MSATLRNCFSGRSLMSRCKFINYFLHSKILCGSFFIRVVENDFTRLGVYLSEGGALISRSPSRSTIFTPLAAKRMKLIDKAIQLKDYVCTGVWREPRNTFKVRVIKTLNLSVVAFLDRGLQSKSMALTYSTVLGIVPVLALLFAIARGFGFQNLIQKEIFTQFPAQQKALETALTFVDSYIKSTSQGLFVGIGLIFLLWTLVSLLSSVEDVFNNIWEIKRDRSIYQKVTDYIAICLLVPILMACSAGINIFMSTMVEGDTPLAILSPVVDLVLEISPFILSWFAITLSYFLIPNTKVNFKYAAIAGAFAALGIEIVQLLFVNGQIYVSKYNAIYGSFAFLPLLLIWLQLSWLILLCGCVLAHSMQNIFGYNYLGDVGNVSHKYLREITIAVMAIIIKRFDEGKPPLTRNEISTLYNLPMSIISRIIMRLHNAHLVYDVTLDNGDFGIIPAVDNDKYTVGNFFSCIDTMGDSGFIPYFNTIFANLLSELAKLSTNERERVAHTLLRDLPIPTPAQVAKIMKTPGLNPYPESETPTEEKEELPMSDDD